MKKITAFVVMMAVTLMFTGSVLAVGPGKTIDFDGKGAGKVVFSGDTHKVNKCNECHPAVFKMKKGSGVGTMKDMNEGKSCGTCHNGTKAFDVKDNASCDKCHKK